MFLYTKYFTLLLFTHAKVGRLLLIALFLYSSALAKGPLTESFGVTGHVGLVTAGVDMHSTTTGEFTIHIPGDPIYAVLYWTGFDRMPGGDSSVDLNINNGPKNTIIAETTYGPDPWWTLEDPTWHLTYRKAVTHLLSQGTSTLNISDFGPMRSNYGVALAVVYQNDNLPVQKVSILEGLDAAYYKYESPRGPNSHVGVVDFEPQSSDRFLEYTLLVGGIINNSRLSAIWHQSGSGSAPSNLIDSPQASVIEGIPAPIGHPVENNMDIYTNRLQVNSGQSYAAFQLESVGDVPDYHAASFNWFALGTVLPLEEEQKGGIGDFCWVDLNQNNLQDSGEPGLENVKLWLLDANTMQPLDSTLTNSSGYYSFTGLSAGDYRLKVSPPPRFPLMAMDEGSDDNRDSDFNPATMMTPTITLAEGEFQDTWDAGFCPPDRSDMIIWVEPSKIETIMNEEFTLTVYALNNGPDPAEQVIVEDEIPEGLVLLTANPSAIPGSEPLTWQFQNVPANETLKIDIRYQTTELLGSIENVFSVHSSSCDPNRENNRFVIEIDNLVPIELASLSTQTVEQGIEIKWSTESESDNFGFYLYRSLDEEGPYEKITPNAIVGQGNSNRAHTYRYLDKSVKTDKDYFYKLVDVDFNGIRTFHGPIMAMTTVPIEMTLYQNYPNPLNPETTILYSLQEAGKVKLSIYNVMGQRVKQLVEDYQAAGHHMVIWNGQDQNNNPLPSGIYFYRLKFNDSSMTRKLELIK